MNMDGTGLTVLKTGLIQNYGLCLDTYARHVYYIQGGNGGSISCHAYGSNPCLTSTYVSCAQAARCPTLAVAPYVLVVIFVVVVVVIVHL